MTDVEAATIHRAPFDASGRLVARRELRLGARTIAPGTQLPADHGLTARQLRVHYQFGMLDTLPAAKPQQKAARR